MSTLREDIIKQSSWTVKTFETDGYILDYTINSLIELDRFFQRNLSNGRPKKGCRLAKNLGGIIFSVSSYIAEVLIKNVPNSHLVTDDSDPDGEINFSVEFGDGLICFPTQRVMKRVTNGLEDSIYYYGYNLTKDILDINFNQEFWNIEKEIQLETESKVWWKVW
ncbi:hypothetical protein BC749_101308 [Flavobacterium araucananum]|uniref:Uncharacterized protein n=1 Tax=Flavobacterium araucananum TaxID=946678 RepID=A0A227NFY6_9FLAO|nr:hypothetical protein [Flavobacterium araucananum]OXE96582.1 hypothetical protein B0A64_23715 [Flavobacterium araucananum]PWK02245.1 hypothetical protein BC749_101308 [Flavobacterium araucananum]